MFKLTVTNSRVIFKAPPIKNIFRNFLFQIRTSRDGSKTQVVRQYGCNTSSAGEPNASMTYQQKSFVYINGAKVSKTFLIKKHFLGPWSKPSDLSNLL